MIKKCSVLILPLALAALLLDTRKVEACSCVREKPTVLESYEGSDIVVVARIVSVETPEKAVDGVRLAKLIVEKCFKGYLKPGAEMTFEHGGGCLFNFEEDDIGTQFLFYLPAKQKGQKLWSATYCGRSKNVDDAADDLLYLENLANARGKTRLSGTLSFYQISRFEDKDTLFQTLSGRRIRVICENHTYELVTNKAGVYEIYGLPPGAYTIEPEIPDGWKIDDSARSTRWSAPEYKNERTTRKHPFRLILEAERHAYFDFAYGFATALRGRLLDTAGKGMKGVCVTIVSGQARDCFCKCEYTDDEGAFDIDDIPPGQYVVAVNKDAKISSVAPFHTLYYPGTFEREKAAVLTVGPGQISEGLNILVPKMEETVTVEGVALFSDGKPVVNALVQFEPDKTSAAVDGRAWARTDSTGRFAIKILTGLSGIMYDEMFTYSGEYLNCPKLEELIKAGPGSLIIRTNALAIQADDDARNLVLRYTFPGCQKAKY